MKSSIVINLNGKEIGFKFTTLTLRLFCEKEKIEFSDIINTLNKNTPSFMLTIIQCANIVYNKGQEIDIYEVDEWIDLMEDEQIRKVWDCFMESIKDFVNKAPKEENVKKK